METKEKNILQNPNKHVVAETSFFSDLCKVIDKSQITPVSEIFYKHDDKTYAFLEHVDITNSIKTTKRNCIKTNFKDIICCVKLKNLPISQYTLEINSHNVATGKFINDECVFDFREHKSPVLKSFIQFSRNSDEPTIENRMNYVNFGRFTNANIYFPKTLNFESNKIDVELTGYFKLHNEWQFGIINTHIYPKTQNNIILYLTSPIDSLELKMTNNTKINVYINNTQVLTHTQSDYDKTIIKFFDPNLKCLGIENNYLSDTINKNTLNFSRINEFRIDVIEGGIMQLHKNVYVIYKYPERELKYDLT